MFRIPNDAALSNKLDLRISPEVFCQGNITYLDATISQEVLPSAK